MIILEFYLNRQFLQILFTVVEVIKDRILLPVIESEIVFLFEFTVKIMSVFTAFFHWWQLNCLFKCVFGIFVMPGADTIVLFHSW